MPLVIVCGQPSSGKTTVTTELASLLRQAGAKCSIIDEPSLHLDRNTAYKDAVLEKNTRGAIRSAVERDTDKSHVTILDSLNNIKGYRYELWCIARALSDRYCCLHVATELATCRAWNEARPAETQYEPSIFDDLGSRFETPIGTNRWDAPLFTVRPGGDAPSHTADVLHAVVTAMTAASTHGGVGGSRDLCATVSTVVPVQSATNLLYEVDQATQAIIVAIMGAQAATGGAALGEVPFGDRSLRLELERVVTLPELRKHKRSFIKVATKSTFDRIQDASGIKVMFVDYLANHLGT